LLAGVRPDDLVLDVNGMCCNAVETAVAEINKGQRLRSVLSLRVLRGHRPDGQPLVFREVELPRKGGDADKGRRNRATNEHIADPGIWLEC
jgi:hypothetical protein